MPRKDREKYNEYQRQWYAANRDVYIKKNQRLREAKRQWLREQKNIPCQDCGHRYPFFVMDFDHREDEKKDGTIARMVAVWSWAKLKAEIAKCDIVCSNCHRIRTAWRGGWYDSEWDDGVPSKNLDLALAGSSPASEA